MEASYIQKKIIFIPLISKVRAVEKQYTSYFSDIMVLIYITEFLTKRWSEMLISGKIKLQPYTFGCPHAKNCNNTPWIKIISVDHHSYLGVFENGIIVHIL